MALSDPYQRRARVEYDAFGSLEVPFDALYGIQTTRALSNFPISGIPISKLPDLINALAQVKKAAARANARLENLSLDKAQIIECVCDEILSGQHHQHFPVDVYQGGAGTSTNMNMNEVIANRGLELMHYPCGSYAHLHPNDDVNRAQSTNDVYPTAIRLAFLSALPRLEAALAQLAQAFHNKGSVFAEVLKLGRTQLQDAVPMTVGAELEAFGSTIREDIARLEGARDLLHEVNLGGTAIGTGVSTPPGFQVAVLQELSELTGQPLKPAANLLEASWDTGAIIYLSSNLKRVAAKLSKISNDLRLLSSGPRSGLGELQLPKVQPGSSMMPGKINPVIPEMVNQVAFQVFGNDIMITFAAEAGQLQLNAFEPIMCFGIMQSIMLLTNAVETLRVQCVEGIEADTDRCLQNLEASTANLTALISTIGYERASQLANEMLRDGTSWTDIFSTLSERASK
ncbi:aspartate ammonia-lyase [Roseibium algae]|uniref:Aspartate ammonia-lyase n=1 Tax=Roseibium algae TaxID=3123038 RepID=A0ABU8TSX7_9HYPH